METDPRTLPDAELVERCRSELPYDTRSFAALVARHEPPVHRTCVRLVGDSEAAEELTQDVFMRVLKGLSGFEARSSFRTWLFRIVRNVCAAHNTKTIRRRELMDGYGRDAYAATDAPSHDVAVATGDRVQDVLGGMEPRDREVLTLRFVSDLSLKEIAEALEISLSAAKMRLYRAESRFKELYAGE